MSFGLNDRDWVDPDEEPAPRGTCAECDNYRECCSRCGRGWCTEFLDAVAGAVEACEAFVPAW